MLYQSIANEQLVISGRNNSVSIAVVELQSVVAIAEADVFLMKSARGVRSSTARDFTAGSVQYAPTCLESPGIGEDLKFHCGSPARRRGWGGWISKGGVLLTASDGMAACISWIIAILTGVGNKVVVSILGINNAETKLYVASRVAKIFSALDQRIPDVSVVAFGEMTPNKSGDTGDMRRSH